MVFLFTDIAGSVNLKTRLGDSEAARLISRHDELFRQTISLAASGRLDQDTGDGFLAEFATASDAVQTALRFQRAIHTEPWGDDPILVRVGVHLGEVAPTRGATGSEPKLIGFAKDIAARLMGLAMPGQILMSRASFDAARQYVREHPGIDSSEPSPELRWMAHGPYLFKGAEEPMDVFEVGAKGIAGLKAPQNSEKAKRAILPGDEDLFGWRPAIGQTIPRREHWILERGIGEGGFGEVWVASHRKVGTHRVFKFCFDAEHLRSLKRELTLFRLLREALGDRPDIAKLHDIQLDKPPFYLESEFTELGNLGDWAESQGGIDKLPLTTRLDLVTGACDAVAAAYSVGILHKDIKPSNILIYEDADGSPCPRLCDFGIGVLTDRSQLERHDITLSGFTEVLPDGADSTQAGTRMYAPPETLMGEPFTIQGDVYALGVLLYQMAAGDLKRPLAPGWEADIADPLLREDIACAVAGRPEDRLRSARELAQRLRTLDERRKTRRRRYAAKVTATVSGILLGLLVVAGAAYLHNRAQVERIEAALGLVELIKDTSPNGVLMADVEGEVIYVNERIVDIAGVPKEKLLKQNVYELQSWKESGMSVLAKLAFDTGQVQSTRNTGESTAGKPFSVAAQFVPIDFENERYLLVTMHDNLILEFVSSIVAGAERYWDPQSEGVVSPPVDMPLTEMLAKAADRAATELSDLPEDQAAIRSMIGRAYLSLGHLRQAEEQLGLALTKRRELSDSEDLSIATSMHEALASAHVDLARVLVHKGDDAGAKNQWEEALGIQEKVLDPRHPAIGETLLGLGELALNAGRYEEAEGRLLESHPILEKAFGPEDEKRTVKARGMLVSLYEAWGKPDKADQWRSSEPIEGGQTPVED